MTTRKGHEILRMATSSILNVLGWAHATDGKKALKISPEFQALGASLNLENLSRGQFTISNKPGRIEKLSSDLDAIAGESSVFQGHINFAAGFYLARGLRFLTKTLTSLFVSSGTSRHFCNLAKALLVSSPPRAYRASDPLSPVLIFTDGAYESQVASAGAIVLDPIQEHAWICQIPVPDDLAEMWVTEAGQQIISEVEAWAALVVRHGFAKTLTNRKTINWIDNESARLSFIKGTSDSPTLRALARVYHAVEMIWPSMVWLERVASFSNPGDPPSRNKRHGIEFNCDASHITPQDHTWLVEAVKKATTDPLAILEA